MKKIILTIVCLLFLSSILFHSQIAFTYASLGLTVWFEKMIPTLFPFMILSEIMIRLQVADDFASFLSPIIKPLYHISKKLCFVMIIGFVCGFPMGAKTAASFYEKGEISKEEASFLLAFTNNIGPVYFTGYLLPLLGITKPIPYLLGMYGIPLLYGWILRYTYFRKTIPLFHTGKNLSICKSHKNATDSINKMEDHIHKKPNLMPHILIELENSIQNGIHTMVTLGAYMILFNMCNLIPYIFKGVKVTHFSVLFELSGGIYLCKEQLHPILTFMFLSFGGFCCIAQTYTCIRKTDLSIKSYLFHKVIVSLLTGGYFLFINTFNSY